MLLVHLELSQWERDFAASGGLKTYVSAFDPFCAWLAKQAPKKAPSPQKHVLNVQQMQSVSELNNYVGTGSGRILEVQKSKIKLNLQH